MVKVGVIGLGFVGYSMYKSFEMKGMVIDENLFGYDKYKNGGMGSFKECLQADILFLALPTKYNATMGKYDKTSIYEVCMDLMKAKYSGAVVIKSTVEPETTNQLQKDFPNLQFVHNPEFLTARTAFEDFHNQTHIVLGKTESVSPENFNNLEQFYRELYPKAEVSLCTALESESMKIFVNCFYSVKVQFFTELYLLCQKNGADFEKIKEMMLKNGWINPMHTTIPGPDGQISYGGLCFPKDTNALNKYMIRENTDNKVLDAVIEERNDMRDDHDNCD